ncbi:hypothetical protein Acsp02_86300 [Actinoplanes sp. NBRC 103695]|nr:hypothetical protein Acsp02_86300 [Actinoplanes sp. NBRC 103695]
MPATTLQHRRKCGTRTKFAICLGTVLAMSSTAGIAFASKNEPAWIRTTQVTVDIKTRLPVPTDGPTPLADSPVASPDASTTPGSEKKPQSAANTAPEASTAEPTTAPTPTSPKTNEPSSSGSRRPPEQPQTSAPDTADQPGANTPESSESTAPSDNPSPNGSPGS